MGLKGCGKSLQTTTLVVTKVANKSFAAGLQLIHVKRLLLLTHMDPNVQETFCISQERVRDTRSCLMPYTHSGLFRAFLVVHNPLYSSGVLVLFHARVADVLSVCVSCVVQRYRTLESEFGVFYHGMLRTMDTLLICVLFFRLLTRNTSCLFVCHIA